MGCHQVDVCEERAVGPARVTQPVSKHAARPLSVLESLMPQAHSGGDTTEGPGKHGTTPSLEEGRKSLAHTGVMTNEWIFAEGRGVVALLKQDLRYRNELVSQVRVSPVCLVLSGLKPSKHGRVGRDGPRRCRVGVAENQPFLTESVDVWG